MIIHLYSVSLSPKLSHSLSVSLNSFLRSFRCVLFFSAFTCCAILSERLSVYWKPSRLFSDSSFSLSSPARFSFSSLDFLPFFTLHVAGSCCFFRFVSLLCTLSLLALLSDSFLFLSLSTLILFLFLSLLLSSPAPLSLLPWKARVLTWCNRSEQALLHKKFSLLFSLDVFLSAGILWFFQLHTFFSVLLILSPLSLCSFSLNDFL